MKKFLFYFGVFIVVWAGVLIGERSSMPIWVKVIHPVVIVMYFALGTSVAYFSATSLGRDRERGKPKRLRELDNGMYLIVRNNKQLAILEQCITGEPELCRLKEPIGDDITAIKVNREGTSVSIELFPQANELLIN